VREMWFWGTEDVNLRQDISANLDQKFRALQCHKSQFNFGDEMRARMMDFARINAKGENFEYAEAFHRVELRP
jgi:LmbE family N-acetylglucosaminyl deacetylase